MIRIIRNIEVMFKYNFITPALDQVSFKQVQNSIKAQNYCKQVGLRSTNDFIGFYPIIKGLLHLDGLTPVGTT